MAAQRAHPCPVWALARRPPWWRDGKHSGVLQGDLGRSLWSRRPVLQLVAPRWPVTLELGIKAIVDIPPNAGGPFIPDPSADGGDGHGILWGLSIGRPAYSGRYRSRLLRFDCSLSRDSARPSR